MHYICEQSEVSKRLEEVLELFNRIVDNGALQPHNNLHRLLADSTIARAPSSVANIDNISSVTSPQLDIVSESSTLQKDCLITTKLLLLNIYN